MREIAHMHKEGNILTEKISEKSESIKKRKSIETKEIESQINKIGKHLEDKDREGHFRNQGIIKNKHSERTVLHKESKPSEEKNRDRRDMFKRQDPVKSKFTENNYIKSVRKTNEFDRGDILLNKARTPPKTNTNNKMNNQPSEGRKLNEIKPKLIAEKFPETAVEAAESNNKNYEINAAVINKFKVGEKKFISDKYYSKSKFLTNQILNKDAKNPVKSDFKNDRAKTQANLKSGSQDVILSKNVSDESEKIKTESDSTEKDKKEPRVSKRPMIKTIKSKNDDRVYKSVTFTEHKRVKPTLLQINIPNAQTKKTRHKLADKNLDSKAPSTHLNSNKSTSKLSVKEKLPSNRRCRLAEKTKRRRLNRCISSPDKFKKIESPPTEVAKWGPSCLNAHTKPYYEAWVNTTLAAITKMSKKDKMFLQKEEIIKTFQRSLETRPASPDLIHEDYKNENYTGRIKIRHSKQSKTKRQPLITPLLEKNI